MMIGIKSKYCIIDFLLSILFFLSLSLDKARKLSAKFNHCTKKFHSFLDLSHKSSKEKKLNKIFCYKLIKFYALT